MTKIKNFNTSKRIFYRDWNYSDSCEDKQIAENLFKIRLDMQPPSHFDGHSCISCSETICDERLELSLFRCFACQMQFEKER